MNAAKHSDNWIQAYFHRLPIRAKLALVITAAAMLVVSVGFASVIYWDLKTIRQLSFHEMQNVFQVLEVDIASYLDESAVEKHVHLEKKLAAVDSLQAAGVYSTNGEQIFSYQRAKETAVAPATLPTIEGERTIKQHDTSMEFVIAIQEQDKRLGYAYFSVSTLPVQQRINGYFRIILLIIPLLIALSVFVAIKFQRSFSDPILQLAKVLKSVSIYHDYSVRIPVDQENEIGELHEGFNNMVEAIEFNMRIIQETRDELECSNQGLMQLNSVLNEQKFALDQAAKVAITDVDGTINYVNNQFCALSKFRQDELLGQKLSMLKSGEHSDAFYRSLWGTITSGRVWKGEIKNRNKDGDYYWVNTTIVPFVDEYSTPYQFLAIYFDITDQKELERKMAIAKEIAEDSSKARAEFVATLSHELREPMQNVLKQLALTLATDLDDHQEDQIKKACQASDALLNLYNDILDYSRVLASELRFDHIQFDLRHASEDVVRHVRKQNNARSMIIHCVYDALLPDYFVGDPTRFRQVLTTLVNIALKFVKDSILRIELLWQPNVDAAVLQVRITSDDLVFSAEQKNRLKKAFAVNDGSIAEVFSGGGMGPALSKQLVRMMGGDLGIESSERGTAFWFTASLDNCPDHYWVQGMETQRHKGKRVLFVGSDRQYRDLEATIAGMGLMISTVASISDVWSMLMRALEQGNPYEMLIFDVANIVEPIYTLSHRIKTDEQGQYTRIVMFCSVAQRGDADHAKSAGLHGFFTKPLPQLELAEALALVMDMPGDHPDRLVTRYTGAEVTAREQHRLLFVGVDRDQANVIVATAHAQHSIIDEIDEPRRLLGVLESHAYDLIFIDLDHTQFDPRPIIQSAIGPSTKKPRIVGIARAGVGGAVDLAVTDGFDALIAKPITQDAVQKIWQILAVQEKNT